MLREIQKLKSKINLLNAHIAQINDCGLFSPTEIADLTAPMVPQVQELQEKIRMIQAKECEVVDAEALTPNQH